MTPVSFERVGDGGDREAVLAQARQLREAGIRIQSVDEERGLLVRSEDASRAREAIDELRRRQEVRLVEPLGRPPDTTVEIPGSKSHTNRALVCAALAAGRSRLSRVLFADDTEAMLGAIEHLGRSVVASPEAGTVEVEGPLRDDLAAATLARPLSVRVKQSGTTSRFLLPVLAATSGRFVLDGHPQLRSRPFGPQLDALRALGADIDGEALPLTIRGRRLAGGSVAVSGTISSQFLSGLLLAAPLFEETTRITVDGPLVSRPYVDLTRSTMSDFGVEVAVEAGGATGGGLTFTVPAGRYRPADVELEPDASAASYFFAAAAITGGRVRVEGLGAGTVQGDLRFVEVLGRMGAEVEVAEGWTEVRGTGALRGIEVDMADLSDTAQSLAVVATSATGPTELTGIGFIRHKETDRIAATVEELRRLGIRAETTEDGMVIHPGRPHPGRVRTYDDHRMAMSFALLGLVHPGIEIENPSCVVKTFPRFFDRLDDLR
jgi:3-phosphoshikimate 1-carboxyvinyltransferase